MTDFRPTDQGWAKADIRLRAILSSWHQSPRYRTEAATRHRSGSVRPSSHSDLSREFGRPRHTEWQWFLIPLLVLVVTDYLSLLYLR
jgi:hypothetical protein